MIMSKMERPEVDDDRHHPMDIFAEMEDKRQKLQIKSAQMSLSAYKEFRIEKDKNNLNTILEKERNSPLEQAQLEHISLSKKIQRRDIIIRNLRRNVAEDNVLARQGETDEIISRALESNQEEKVIADGTRREE